MVLEKIYIQRYPLFKTVEIYSYIKKLGPLSTYKYKHLSINEGESFFHDINIMFSVNLGVWANLCASRLISGA